MHDAPGGNMSIKESKRNIWDQCQIPSPMAFHAGSRQYRWHQIPKHHDLFADSGLLFHFLPSVFTSGARKCGLRERGHQRSDAVLYRWVALVHRLLVQPVSLTCFVSLFVQHIAFPNGVIHVAVLVAKKSQRELSMNPVLAAILRSHPAPCCTIRKNP